MACAEDLTRKNSECRVLELELDILGAVVMNENYEAKKNKPYYNDIKEVFPVAIKHLGTFTGAEFTPTVSPTWAIDSQKDKYAVFFKELDVTTLNTAATFHEIGCVDYQIQKIVSNTATAITVGETILTGTTAVIIVDEKWYSFAQIRDFAFDDTAATIDANDADTGGYSAKIGGIKEADLTGVTGNLHEECHTLAMIEKSKLNGKKIHVRHASSLTKFATAYYQYVTCNSFVASGTKDGSGILTYTGTLLNNGQPKVLTVMTTGVMPE